MPQVTIPSVQIITSPSKGSGTSHSARVNPAEKSSDVGTVDSRQVKHSSDKQFDEADSADAKEPYFESFSAAFGSLGNVSATNNSSATTESAKSKSTAATLIFNNPDSSLVNKIVPISTDILDSSVLSVDQSEAIGIWGAYNLADQSQDMIEATFSVNTDNSMGDAATARAMTESGVEISGLFSTTTATPSKFMMSDGRISNISGEASLSINRFIGANEIGRATENGIQTNEISISDLNFKLGGQPHDSVKTIFIDEAEISDKIVSDGVGMQIVKAGLKGLTTTTLEGNASLQTSMQGAAGANKLTTSITLQLQQQFASNNRNRMTLGSENILDPMSITDTNAESGFADSLVEATNKAELLPASMKVSTTTGILANDRVQVTASVRVGMPGWADQIAERTASLAAQNIKQAEIQLNPQELGPIHVKISVNGEQAAVTFIAQHAATREALDQSLQRLRENFEAEGLDLIQADVSDDSQNNRQQENSDDKSSRARLSEKNDSLDYGDSPAEVIPIKITSILSGIDDFV